MDGMQEVRSSILLVSTIENKGLERILVIRTSPIFVSITIFITIKCVQEILCILLNIL